MPEQTCELANCMTQEEDVQRVTFGLQPVPMLITPLGTYQVWLCVNHRVPPDFGIVPDDGEGVPMRLVLVVV